MTVLVVVLLVIAYFLKSLPDTRALIAYLFKDYSIWVHGVITMIAFAFIRAEVNTIRKKALDTSKTAGTKTSIAFDKEPQPSLVVTNIVSNIDPQVDTSVLPITIFGSSLISTLRLVVKTIGGFIAIVIIGGSIITGDWWAVPAFLVVLLTISIIVLLLYFLILQPRLV